MAWRRPVTPPRVEAPAWYRNYDPAGWDEPDGQELGMIGGCTGPGRGPAWPGAVEWVPGWPVFHGSDIADLRTTARRLRPDEAAARVQLADGYRQGCL